MPSSRSCLGVASPGAPISRSSACWFIGNSVISRRFFAPHEQHDDAVDARRHAAMRRRAILEGAVEAAEALFDVLARQADHLEGLDHGLRQMVADAAGGDLEAVADEVVLERLDRQRILRSFSASMPPCGIENGLWAKSTFFSSSFHS